MDILNTMIVTNIIGILTLIASCVAIYVALYLGRKSSKDCKRMIAAYKENADAQINEIRLASRNEIKEFRTLIHTILVSSIHDLENENKTLKVNSEKSRQKYLELRSRYERIKDFELKETDAIIINEINSHFSEMNMLAESMLELKANNEYYQRLADNINTLLNHFISLDNQLSSNIQYE